MANQSNISGLGEVQLGTTIMGLKYDRGVILCADSRTSNGPIVVNRVAKKLTKICDKIYLCRAGSAADTQAVASLLKYYLSQNVIESAAITDSAPEERVRSCAAVARLIGYENRDALSYAFIVGGVDNVEGPQIYYVAPGGTIFEKEFACTGSGSTYIAGLCDHLYRSNLTQTEALALAQKLVNHAMMRDGSSGGIIRYVVIDKVDGVAEGYVRGEDVLRLEDTVSF